MYATYTNYNYGQPLARAITYTFQTTQTPIPTLTLVLALTLIPKLLICYAYSCKYDTKRMVLSTAVNKRLSSLEKKVNRRCGANLRKFGTFRYKPWLQINNL